MPKFLVRKTISLSAVVDAINEDEALDIGWYAEDDIWETDDTDFEVEDVTDEYEWDDDEDS
ncbi:MAG: hypothetical protein WC965_01200 [Thiohalomonadaceae bacterium]